MTQKTDDQLLTAGALSQASGVPQLTIRNWARKGWLTFRLDSTNRRIFDQKSVEAAKALRARKTFRVDGSKHGRPPKDAR